MPSHHEKRMTEQTQATAPARSDPNPLLADFGGPFGVSPFAAIEAEHFSPAFDHAFVAHNAEIGAIAGDTAEPTFDNTIVALELAGRELSRVADVFGLL